MHCLLDIQHALIYISEQRASGSNPVLLPAIAVQNMLNRPTSERTCDNM